MQLLVLILKKVELMDDLIKKLAESGLHGGTILDGAGMAGSLVDMDDLPMFMTLRHMLSDGEKEVSKVLLFVMKDEQVLDARNVIKEMIGDLKEPNTGIMFSIPISQVEGLGE